MERKKKEEEEMGGARRRKKLRVLSAGFFNRSQFSDNTTHKGFVRAIV